MRFFLTQFFYNKFTKIFKLTTFIFEVQFFRVFKTITSDQLETMTDQNQKLHNVHRHLDIFQLRITFPVRISITPTHRESFRNSTESPRTTVIRLVSRGIRMSQYPFMVYLNVGYALRFYRVFFLYLFFLDICFKNEMPWKL